MAINKSGEFINNMFTAISNYFLPQILHALSNRTSLSLLHTFVVDTLIRVFSP